MIYPPNKTKICVVGQGYVGLPLSIEFSKYFEVTGFDINSQKIESLKKGLDPGQEIKKEDIIKSNINFTTDPKSISQSNFIIVAVPTPINKARDPDLSYVESATKLVGQNIKEGSTIVYESTVYPGVTEEVCIPIIEKESGFKCGTSFKIGYSPERINPGDKDRTIDKITKIVSGMDKESLDFIDKTYSQIIKAGVYRAESIKVAEAAKVIENTQRDLNIALMNELSLIFDKIGIDVMDVIKAAGSKWNFHKYHPGLVGGHCISVDPHYLLWKSKQLGYDPKVILAGRDVNEYMPIYIAEKAIMDLNHSGKKINGSNVLILGLAFKDNVNDIRNSKIKNTIKHLKKYDINIDAYEPLVDNEIISRKFEVKNVDIDNLQKKYDCIIISRNHKKFIGLDLKKLKNIMNENPILIDIAYRFNKKEAKEEGFIYRSF